MSNFMEESSGLENSMYMLKFVMICLDEADENKLSIEEDCICKWGDGLLDGVVRN